MKTEPLGHDWGEWEVTTPATENSEGVETRTCLRCGQTETRAYAGADLYRVVDGDGSTWTKGSGEVLVFTAKRVADDETTYD